MRDFGLSGLAMVVPEHSAESLVAPHIAVAEADIFVRVNQPIVQSLMIPLPRGSAQDTR